MRVAVANVGAVVWVRLRTNLSARPRPRAALRGPSTRTLRSANLTHMSASIVCIGEECVAFERRMGSEVTVKNSISERHRERDTVVVGRLSTLHR